MSPLPTPLPSKEIHRPPCRAKNCIHRIILKTLLLLELSKEKYKRKMNCGNIYVFIKSCKESYYKSPVLAKRKNEYAPESSENSCSVRLFVKKSLLKRVFE